MHVFEEDRMSCAQLFSSFFRKTVDYVNRCVQRWDSKLLRTGSLITGLTNNRFSHYQSPDANHAGWPEISAKVDLYVANWYSLAREFIDFRYFPKF